jgi:hypothetical protein
MRKLNLCLEASCLFARGSSPGAAPTPAALRFIARAVRRFKVTVWAGSAEPGALSVKEHVCDAMVEELGRERGYLLASLVSFAQEPPQNAVVITAARLERAGSWRAIEAEIAESRATPAPRFGAAGLVRSLAG